jgi:hypothetical protein
MGGGSPRPRDQREVWAWVGEGGGVGWQGGAEKPGDWVRGGLGRREPAEAWGLERVPAARRRQRVEGGERKHLRAIRHLPGKGRPAMGGRGEEPQPAPLALPPAASALPTHLVTRPATPSRDTPRRPARTPLQRAPAPQGREEGAARGGASAGGGEVGLRLGGRRAEDLGACRRLGGIERWVEVSCGGWGPGLRLGGRRAEDAGRGGSSGGWRCRAEDGGRGRGCGCWAEAGRGVGGGLGWPGLWRGGLEWCAVWISGREAGEKEGRGGSGSRTRRLQAGRGG